MPILRCPFRCNGCNVENVFYANSLFYNNEVWFIGPIKDVVIKDVDCNALVYLD